MDYEQLLERAKDKIPESVLNRERFEVMNVKGHIQGNRTIISNFYQIAESFNRTPEHLLKFVLKELATPGELKKNALIIGTKVPATRINEKINVYADYFVICPECKKPDTKLMKEGNVTYIKCLACGARRPVRAKIG